MFRPGPTPLIAAALLLLGAAPVAAQPTPAPAPAPAPAGKASKLVYTQQAMGTNIQVTIWSGDELVAARGAEAVFAEFRRIDAMMTTWTSTSEVSRINAAAGKKKAVRVSDETLAVVARALEASRKSGGVFDITVGAYKGLWKFDQDMDGTLPSQAEVRARRALVDWTQLTVDRKKKTVRLGKKGMAMTLGGIAKGYAVDRGVALLRAAGLSDFIVQAGGDLYVSGDKAGTPWVVGIRDPRGGRDSSFAILPLRDHSFSTSGDYERGFVKEGVRYHHILDPRTGQPARKTRSVTIMAKDAFTADAWSKVLFILGAEAAMPLVEQLPDFEAVFVDADNRVHVSSGLKDKLKVLHEPTPGI